MSLYSSDDAIRHLTKNNQLTLKPFIIYGSARPPERVARLQVDRRRHHLVPRHQPDLVLQLGPEMDRLPLLLLIR